MTRRPPRGPVARVRRPLVAQLPFLRHWSLLQQLAGVDRPGRGAAVQSLRTTRLAPRTATAERVVPSVCPHCTVGCGLQVHVARGQVVNVEGDPASPLSRGRLCPAGAAIGRHLADPGRVTTAMHRPAGSDQWQPVDLGAALDLAAERVLATRRRTWQWADASGRRVRRAVGLAWLAGDGLDLEARYLADKLATALGVAPPAGTGPLAVLADTTGRGGSTGSLPDLAAADCIVVVGADLAASHPVAMQWVAEARAAGASVVHVHPDVTATSALADVHVPVRSGTASVLLRGAVAAVLAHEQWQRRAVVAYTGAAAVVDDDDGTVLGAAGGAVPPDPPPDAARDETLGDRRTVLQRLRAAVAVDTPAAVADRCGTPEALVELFWRTIADHSSGERTTAVVTVAGPAGPPDAADVVRAAITLQLLLGNVGRPGGGLLVLHGDADAPAPVGVPRTTSAGKQQPARLPVPADLLPGRGGGPGPAGPDPRAVSLRKAWWGAAANPANAFGDDWVPRPDGDAAARAAAAGGGWVVLGDGAVPVTGGGDWDRQVRALDFLVVHGTAVPPWVEAATGASGPEVILLPATHPVEHRGTSVSADRLLQHHEAAVEPAGDARSALWVTHQLGQRIRHLLAGSADEADEPVLALTWDYPEVAEGPGPTDDDRRHRPGDLQAVGPSAAAVLAEANGWDATGRLLAGPEQLRADGSTACGLWAVCGVLAGGHDRAARRPAPDGQGRLGRGWGWAWPGDRRVLGNRASADPEGRPWSERTRLMSWDEERARWVGDDEPDIDPSLAPAHRPAPGVPGARSGIDAFPDRPDGKGRLAVTAQPAPTTQPAPTAGRPPSQVETSASAGGVEAR